MTKYSAFQLGFEFQNIIFTIKVLHSRLDEFQWLFDKTNASVGALEHKHTQNLLRAIFGLYANVKRVRSMNFGTDIF